MSAVDPVQWERHREKLRDEGTKEATRSAIIMPMEIVVGSGIRT